MVLGPSAWIIYMACPVDFIFILDQTEIDSWHLQDAYSLIKLQKVRTLQNQISAYQKSSRPVA